MAADSDNPFWDFSLAVYHRPGVAQACLALQDRRGLDVNLLLFCCWAGSLGRRLEPQDIARLRRAVGDWQERVPLAETRTAADGSFRLELPARPDEPLLVYAEADGHLARSRSPIEPGQPLIGPGPGP